MKSNYLLNFSNQAAALFSAAVLTVAHVSAEVPLSSSLQINHGTNQVSAIVTIADPGNRVWILQSSSDFLNWSEIDAWKLHNGSFHRSLSAAAPSAFFRAVYDPARQDILNTTANALLLPEASFNYAAPALPPSFSVRPILAQDNMPATNVTTDAGATLGRVLFYDNRLSTNQTISCSSCHQQKNAFPIRAASALASTADSPAEMRWA